METRENSLLNYENLLNKILKKNGVKLPKKNLDEFDKIILEALQQNEVSQKEINIFKSTFGLSFKKLKPEEIKIMYNKNPNEVKKIKENCITYISKYIFIKQFLKKFS